MMKSNMNMTSAIINLPFISNLHHRSVVNIDNGSRYTRKSKSISLLITMFDHLHSIGTSDKFSLCAASCHHSFLTMTWVWSTIVVGQNVHITIYYNTILPINQVHHLASPAWDTNAIFITSVRCIAWSDKDWLNLSLSTSSFKEKSPVTSLS